MAIPDMSKGIRSIFGDSSAGEGARDGSRIEITPSRVGTAVAGRIVEEKASADGERNPIARMAAAYRGGILFLFVDTTFSPRACSKELENE